jgi:N-ethylmaleimide reductase
VRIGPSGTWNGMADDTAEAIVEKGDADLVTFGRYFISNPDLPKGFMLRTTAQRLRPPTF